MITEERLVESSRSVMTQLWDLWYSRQMNNVGVREISNVRIDSDHEVARLEQAPLLTDLHRCENKALLQREQRTRQVMKNTAEKCTVVDALDNRCALVMVLADARVKERVAAPR